MDESDLDFAIDEINREQTRWNYMEAELNAAEKRIVELEAALKQQTAYCKKCCRDNKYSPLLVATEKKVVELEKELEEIRDLARTGLAPLAYGMTSLEWDRHRINKVAGMADEALNK